MTFKNFIVSKLPGGNFIYPSLFYVLPAILFMYFLSDVMMPFLLAIVISYTIVSLAKNLEASGVNKRLSIPIVSLLFVNTIIIFLILIVPMAWEQAFGLAKESPILFDKTRQWAMDTAYSFGGEGAGNFVHTIFQSASSTFMKGVSMVLNATVSSIFSLFTVLLYVVLVPILVFFMVRDRKIILRYFSRFLSPDFSSSVSLYWSRINPQLVSYIVGKLIEVLVVGFCSLLLFSIFDLKYSVLLAVAVGFSVLVPFVGAFLVTIPVIAIALTQFGFGSHALILIALYFSVQILDGNVLVPYIFSERLKIHPLAIVFGVLVFGALAGVFGVFFAIPLLAVLKILIDVKLPPITS